MTVAALADAIGVKRPWASQIVNGWTLPSAEQLDAIAKALGVAATELYGKEVLTAIETTRGTKVA